MLDKALQDTIKCNLGKAATNIISNHMTVGLGSGSTACHFIRELGKKINKEHLSIKTVPSSEESRELAIKFNIPITYDFSHIDITVDGADEIDFLNRLIKGKGGALTKEKILAQASKRFLIIADESKIVSNLGINGLPIEIMPFGINSTIEQLESLGYKGQIRLINNSPFITDNNNYIFDITFPSYFPCPEKDHQILISIPGIIETGFFFFSCDVLIGYKNGTCLFKDSPKEPTS